MYSDHRKGFSEALALQARSRLLFQLRSKMNSSLNESYIFERQFDEYGDVKRDYKKELEMYVKDEEEILLPQVKDEFFFGTQRYRLFVESKPDFNHDVDVLPQLPRQLAVKVQPKWKMLSFKLLQDKLVPKFTLALKSLF